MVPFGRKPLPPPQSPSNTGDKLRSSIACAGFVCFIPLFDGAAILLPNMNLNSLGPDALDGLEVVSVHNICSGQHVAEPLFLRCQRRQKTGWQSATQERI